MGGGQTKLTACEICLEEINIRLDNACNKTLCLCCNLNHAQDCLNCFKQDDQPGEVTNKEIKKIFKYVSDENKRKNDHLKEITALKKENQQLRENVAKISSENSVLGQRVALLTSEMHSSKQEAHERAKNLEALTQRNRQLMSELSKKEGIITVLQQVNDTMSKQLKQFKKAEVTAQPEPKFCIEPTVPENLGNKRYFIDIGTYSGVELGRIVIESIPDKAPNMCRVFDGLIKGIGGIYLRSQVVLTRPKNYIVFQNAKNMKTEIQLYPADVNDLQIKRGAVGMRVQGIDQTGRNLVKSQFVIALTDTPPPQFSYVFGYVIKGDSICEKISCMTNSNIFIQDLGTLP